MFSSSFPSKQKLKLPEGDDNKEQADSNSLPAGPEPPAHSVQLRGNDMFVTPEVEDLAKDLQAIQEDVQVHTTSNPQQPK